MFCAKKERKKKQNNELKAPMGGGGRRGSMLGGFIPNINLPYRQPCNLLLKYK